MPLDKGHMESAAPGWRPQRLRATTGTGATHALRCSPRVAVTSEEDWQGHLVKEHLWPALVEGAVGADSVFMAKDGLHWEAPKPQSS